MLSGGGVGRPTATGTASRFAVCRSLHATRARAGVLPSVMVTARSSNSGAFIAKPRAQASSMSVPISVSRMILMRGFCAAAVSAQTSMARIAHTRVQEPGGVVNGVVTSPPRWSRHHTGPRAPRTLAGPPCVISYNGQGRNDLILRSSSQKEPRGIQTTRRIGPVRARPQSRHRHVRRRQRVLQALGHDRRRRGHAARRHLPRRRAHHVRLRGHLFRRPGGGDPRPGDQGPARPGAHLHQGAAFGTARRRTTSARRASI